jgi:hypothetical protein
MKEKEYKLTFTFNLTTNSGNETKDFSGLTTSTAFVDKKQRQVMWESLGQAISNYDFSGKSIISVTSTNSGLHAIDDIKNINVVAALCFSGDFSINLNQYVYKIIKLLESKKHSIYNKSLLQCATRSNKKIIEIAARVVAEYIHYDNISADKKLFLIDDCNASKIISALSLDQKNIMEVVASRSIKEIYRCITGSSRADPVYHANAITSIAGKLFPNKKKKEEYILELFNLNIICNEDTWETYFKLRAIKSCLDLLDIEWFSSVVNCLIINKPEDIDRHCAIGFLRSAHAYKYNRIDNLLSLRDSHIVEIFEITQDYSLLASMDPIQKRRALSNSLDF